MHNFLYYNNFLLKSPIFCGILAHYSPACPGTCRRSGWGSWVPWAQASLRWCTATSPGATCRYDDHNADYGDNHNDDHDDEEQDDVVYAGGEPRGWPLQEGGGGWWSELPPAYPGWGGPAWAPGIPSIIIIASPVCLSVRYCSSRDNVKDLKFFKHLICCRLVHLLGGRRHLRLQSRERDLLQRHL